MNYPQYRFQMMKPRDDAERVAQEVCKRAHAALTRAVMNWSGVEACRKAHAVAMHYRDSLVNGRHAQR